MTRHPGDDRLMHWLESGKPRRVGRHVEACDICLVRVEVVSDLDGGLLSELESASAPPDDLHVRTTGGVQGRLAAEESLVAWLELFSVPWQTATALMEIDPIGAQRTPSPTDDPPAEDRSDQNDQYDQNDQHDPTDDEEQADG